MIKRAHLRQFLAVVDTGSFTRAAERVGVAQPSLSAGIAELERLVGSRLFLRERRRIRLTDAGNHLLTHARAIEREFRLAESDLATVAPVAAPFRLGVLPSVATGQLGRISAGWRSGRSLVLIEGSDADLRRQLGDGQLDAALTSLRPGDVERGAVELRDEAYRVLLAANHPLAVRRELVPADLAGETMIARRSCEILPETSRFFTGHGIRPAFFLRSANDDRCLEMVRIGMGITTGPESLAGEGIVALPLEGYDYRRRLGLVFPRDVPVEGALVDACREAFV